MSKESLTRIEKSLKQIERRLDRLEVLAQASSGSAPTHGVLGFLDRFRAGEALGEASLGAWIEVCETACLKGGLRTVQQREGFHARLLEARIKELGGSPRAEIPAADFRRAMENAGSRERSDLEKLQEFTAQFSDPDAAVKPILDFADRLDSDPETQSLLRTIADDERATVAFLCGACAQLSAADSS